MLAKSDKEGYALAKSLGLKTEYLASLSIDFKPGHDVVVTAVYYADEPTVVTILEPLKDVKKYRLTEVQ